MNKLSLERRTRVVKALVEGSSIRSTARMTDSAINTVMKLLIDLVLLAWTIRMPTFGALATSGCSVTRFGALYTPRLRMYQRNTRASWGMVMFGPGRQLTQRPN